jgi:hypothetical protein
MGLLFALILIVIPLGYALFDLKQSGDLPNLRRRSSGEGDRSADSAGDESVKPA